ncbi:hypothetical protein [uncultured Anaerococcus sp.]|uniref:hypothetical protein n=1 Tax=uncultured Anaerococcus sp. TaxID=293428 RepID=UPI002620C8E7|nr:hypothetical protein [uncultured Anaerococcus sp.]
MSSYDLILKKKNKSLTLNIASIKGEEGKPLDIEKIEVLENRDTKITFDNEKQTSIIIPSGKDAISPIINTEDQSNKLLIKITDKDGDKQAEIPYGKDGYTPVKGKDYFDGKDGFSPTVKSESQAEGTLVTITDANGNTEFKVLNGKDGIVTVDNLSDEELIRFKNLALPTLEEDLKRATEFDALEGTDDKRIMTPLTTKKAIESYNFDEKINEKASISNIEKTYNDAMVALAHLADTGKDLVDNGGKLFRSDIEVGVRVKNAGTTYTIPDTVQKARIYFKAQCEEPTFDNYIFFWVGDGTDENQRFVSKLENRTRHYSAEVNLENSHEIVISTVQAWDKTVKVWDFDWKEVL